MHFWAQVATIDLTWASSLVAYLTDYDLANLQHHVSQFFKNKDRHTFYWFYSVENPD